jgi:hypothetical protein
MQSEEYQVLLHILAGHDAVIIDTHQSDNVSEKLTASVFMKVLQIFGCLYVQDEPFDNKIRHTLEDWKLISSVEGNLHLNPAV